MPEINRRFLGCCLVAMMASACANPEVRPSAPTVTPEAGSLPSNNSAPIVDAAAVRVTSPTRQGHLEFVELTEVSGLAASQRLDNVLWAINDSGNEAAVYALDQQGRHLGKWPLAATSNRDWEDLASIWHNGDAYLLIAETGDNLRLYSEYKIHILQEPQLDTSDSTSDNMLYPLATLSFRYADGKHNVEAMSVIDDSIILISKEPLAGSTHSPGKVYHLPFQLASNTRLLEANYLTTLAQQDASLESRLAAALTGVSLNNVTALDFDRVNRIAYLLTYRQLIKLPLQDIVGDSLANVSHALAQHGSVIHEHSLQQAEAMTVDSLGQVWLSSENAQAPLWVLPAPQ